MPEAGPAFRFQIRRRVEFSETDMAGIVHYSQFFRYMESAEHAFFRSLGMSIAPKGTGAVGWPRVHASCDFRRPLRFEDEFDVELLVRERGERSLKYLFRFWKDGTEIARGRLAVACVRRDADGTMRSVTIPGDVVERIGAAPEELLGAEWTV